MAGKIKLSFHHRVLLSLLSLCWLLVAVFALFQFHREKQFRNELMNTILQMHNARIIDDMAKGETIGEIVSGIEAPLDSLRVTLVDRSGTVVFDSNHASDRPESNHNNRPEITAARSRGAGYSVGRKSATDQSEYFYSATLAGDGTVVRSAAPCNTTLRSFLEADRSFLWIMFLLTSGVSIAGFIIARRISTSISHLDSFAEKAGKGERIYDDWSFPHDELGRIAANIVRLYVERDQKHQEALMQERDKIRLKKQLTNNISHELKTPVASIKVCADLLRDHPELPDDKKQNFVKIISGDADRLASMLDDVASIMRLDDGAAVITKEPVDVKSLVDSVVANESVKTDMAIISTVPPMTINGNRQLLESLFRNLIDNAIAYSGGSEITIAADSQGNFTVRDNGCGVASEHLPYLFERFYRVDKGRSRLLGGTGLGLSIVKNAVAIHGGTIKVSNDGGLRFDFSLGGRQS